MAKLRGYWCSCGHRFEHTFYLVADEATLPNCPECSVQVTEKDETFGAQKLDVIVPMHRTSLRSKAGYVHTHGDRPAEKGSVAVPSKANL